MRTTKHLSLFVLVIAMVSCNKQNEPELNPIKKIEIQTSQDSYQLTGKITYKIENNTSREIMYHACQYQSNPAIAIQKKMQDSWEVIDASVCPEFTWIQLNEGEIRHDTISLFLNGIGTYRLEIRFVDNQKDTLIYSNNFEMTD